MSSTNDDILTNNLSYIQNLVSVPIKLQSNATTQWGTTIAALSSAIATPTDSTAQTTLINNFFASFNSNTKPLPSTFDGFVSAFSSFVTSNGGTMASGASATIATGLLSDYELWTSSGSDPSTGDWSVISPTPTTADLTTQMKAWFGQFLSTYPYTSTGAVGTSATAFFAAASAQLLITAGIQEGTTLSAAGTQQSLLPRYQTIYKMYFPNGDFATRFNQFYTQEVKEDGFFNPSQAFAEWTSQIQEEFAQSTGVGTLLDQSSLVSGDFGRTLVLDKIFLLITALIGSLQDIAAVQSNRLVTLSKWQNAYTNVIGQLHVFLSSDGTPLSTNKSFDQNAVGTVRATLNDTINTTFKEKLQSFQSLVGDDAKALQSNINQSNDAVSQQANMATAIIQELTTLLSAVNRS